MLSDAVGDSVARLRRAAGLTREELAERCTALGWAISAAAITNVESGRYKEKPDPATGKARKVRTREITVDELVTLARALDVAPLSLLYPAGVQEVSSWDYVNAGTPWIAARQFMGDDTWDGRNPVEHPAYRSLVLHHAHDRLMEMYSDLLRAGRDLETEDGKEPDLIDAFRLVRQAMAGDGLLLPWIPAGINRYLYDEEHPAPTAVPRRDPRGRTITLDELCREARLADPLTPALARRRAADSARWVRAPARGLLPDLTGIAEQLRTQSEATEATEGATTTDDNTDL